MIIRSINSRLLLSLTLFVGLSLGLSGYVLDHAFRSSVETALEEKLKAHLYALLADSNAEQGQLVMPEALQDPLFNRIESGLYAVINDANGNELWRSASAIALNTLPTPNVHVGRFLLTAPTEQSKHPLFLLSYGIIWELETGEEHEYHIYLWQSAQPVIAEISAFRTSLWRWFSAIAIVLLLIQGSIMRWGLRPLRKLASELQAIETGQQNQLTGDYPSELENVTPHLNLLLDNERRQRQRYRDTLADLAHSLKTPLAILRGLGDEPDKQQHLDEQVTRMDDIISHQLQRAGSHATAHTLSMQPLPLAPLVDKLLRSLNKVYADKAVNSQQQIDQHTTLRVDERDLMEVLGNLLDNAFKACQQQVMVRSDTTISANEVHLNIYIEDDGDGIATEQRTAVLQRGGRADTQHPGQGIGLSVAQDILNSYQAQLHIGNSALGGAKIGIEFPLA